LLTCCCIDIVVIVVHCTLRCCLLLVVVVVIVVVWWLLLLLLVWLLLRCYLRWTFVLDRLLLDVDCCFVLVGCSLRWLVWLVGGWLVVGRLRCVGLFVCGRWLRLVGRCWFVVGRCCWRWLVWVGLLRWVNVGYPWLVGSLTLLLLDVVAVDVGLLLVGTFVRCCWLLPLFALRWTLLIWTLFGCCVTVTLR